MNKNSVTLTKAMCTITFDRGQAVVAEWQRLALRGWGVLKSNPGDGGRSWYSVVDCTHSLHWKQGIFLPRGFSLAPPVHSYPIVSVKDGVLSWPATAVRQVEHTHNTKQKKDKRSE